MISMAVFLDNGSPLCQFYVGERGKQVPSGVPRMLPIGEDFLEAVKASIEGGVEQISLRGVVYNGIVLDFIMKDDKKLTPEEFLEFMKKGDYYG